MLLCSQPWKPEQQQLCFLSLRSVTCGTLCDAQHYASV